MMSAKPLPKTGHYFFFITYSVSEDVLNASSVLGVVIRINRRSHEAVMYGASCPPGACSPVGEADLNPVSTPVCHMLSERVMLL